MLDARTVARADAAAGTRSGRAGAGAALEPVDFAELRARICGAGSRAEPGSRVHVVARRPARTGARALALGGVRTSLRARRPQGRARALRAGARVQRVRSIVPLRSASCDGRNLVEPWRARRLETSLRSCS